MSPCFHSAFTDLSLSRPSTAPPASQCSPQPGCCAGLCGASQPAGESRPWMGNTGCSGAVGITLFGALFRAQLMITHSSTHCYLHIYHAINIVLATTTSTFSATTTTVSATTTTVSPNIPLPPACCDSDILMSPHVSWKLRSSGLQCDAVPNEGPFSFLHRKGCKVRLGDIPQFNKALDSPESNSCPQHSSSLTFCRDLRLRTSRIYPQNLGSTMTAQ